MSEAQQVQLSDQDPPRWISRWIRQKLLDDGERIFAKKRVSFEVWKAITPEKHGNVPLQGELKKLHVDDAETIHQLSLGGSDTKEDKIAYILRSTNSYSRLLIPQHILFGIVDHHNIFPVFMDLIQTFGFRIEADGDLTDHFAKQASTEVLEICYRLQYFEKNNREQGDPWSSRRTGIYQQFHTRTQRSLWILVRPSAEVEKGLDEQMRESAQSAHALFPHTWFLLSSTNNWKEYIDSLEERMKTLELTTCYMDVELKNENKFSIRFADRQNLQLLRRKLWTASTMLEVAVGLGEKMRGLFAHQNLPDEHQWSFELDVHKSHVESYQRRVASLLERSSETSSLVNAMLDHRTTNSIRESGDATHQSLEAMRCLAVQQEQEAKLSHQNSLKLKALTIVATLYLPPSLLATIFSSNLVLSQPTGDNEHTTRLVLAPDFWKFLVILVPTMMITLAATYILQHPWRIPKFRIRRERKVDLGV